MIKVDDVNKSSNVSSSGKTAKASGGESFASYLSKPSSSNTATVSAPSNVFGVDAIFATQMVDGDEEREVKKKLLKRGATMLEKLEEIRDGLLMGYISKDKLIEISRFVKDKRFNTEDERLNDILQEIELRVEVELAKLMK